ncbi:hypothetical protein AUK11_02925 [bacterium CG2_30_37_16]|nr:MAG: hypothetical protein AUK11_02925 [bacterium CG2_30_37_16]PIP30886.1 MAG: magnesium transporter CorA [bacterium (Candidatus Howlettbacteria) CG23_combo_of_CG06-09_8_20_14_all_37_9]PJB06604.1 MAG: magnesium transporter CorA [bacterium (Candidatus Howlettbacteria) CG_4_9_14_3_um_filter_37_10]
MQTVTTENFTWLNIENPTAKDIAFLKQNYTFHDLNLEDCLSDIQRPKVDVQPDHIFIVLHFPRYFKAIKKIIASEVDIFLGQNYMITLHRGDLKPLNYFFNQMKKNKVELDSLVKKGSAMVLYELISQMFEYCFPVIDKISEHLNTIESAMFKERPSSIVPEIARINQEIITFRKTIAPERRVILDLEDRIRPYSSAGNDLYFDDMTDLIEKIWDNLENFREVSESLQRTHDSYITYRLNEGIKILTVFSAILLPLTLITGYYGMNVEGLPIARHPLSAELIFLSMLAIVGLLLYLFKKKDIL